MTFVPSPQQAAVFEFIRHGRGSAIIEAVAGAGKTTTLVEVCKIIAQSRATAVFTAFNKKIAEEIGAKLQAAGIDWKTCRSATFHSLGFSAWKKAAPGVVLDEKKLDKIMEEEHTDDAGNRVPFVPVEYRSFARILVSLAKQSAVGTLWQTGDSAHWYDMIDHFDLVERLENVKDSDPVERGIEYARRVLGKSIELDREVVDFDDMIFAPIYHDVRFWQYDYVLVDEAQDTNAARRIFARKMLKPGGRLIAVGDRHQAIYGFTGADSDALDLIAEEFGAIRLPLTVTYRCPQVVVQHARQWVSHIEAHPTAPMGSLLSISFDGFVESPPESFDKSSAVLCRNTKPLVELAFSLIRRRIPCHVEGRDIGEGLIRLANRWKTAKTIGDLRDRLSDYLDRETERLLVKQQEAKLQQITDRVETLNAFMDTMTEDAPVSDLDAEIRKVFADSPAPGITLSTIHKAKGREWDRVYWLGRNRWQPSPFARQAWQIGQENNLMYVACTRAKSVLIEIEVPFNSSKKRAS